MNTIILFAFACCLVSAFAAPQSKFVGAVCDNSYCKLPKCKCSEVPRGNDGTKPQFVVLSFDDALSPPIYDTFIKPMFLNRKNPDGCPVSGTFFVPHEYTYYSVVNALYGHGFEIASHSITKNFLQEYWRNATISQLTNEMAGQRTILSKFANIPNEAIIGARIPQLQINADTFKALHSAGFQYDASWPTPQNWPFAPYTLDYDARQQCHVVNCQTVSTPGLWEMPIVDWLSQDGINCNSVDACAVEGNEDEIFQWMKKNFNAINRTGAPITFRINYSWFVAQPEHKGALEKFLDFIGSIKNTFIVSHNQVLEWSKNPTGNFSSCQKIKPTPCNPINCRLLLNGMERYMTSCVPCPKNYPWLENPLGGN